MHVRKYICVLAWEDTKFIVSSKRAERGRYNFKRDSIEHFNFLHFLVHFLSQPQSSISWLLNDSFKQVQVWHFLVHFLNQPLPSKTNSFHIYSFHPHKCVHIHYSCVCYICTYKNQFCASAFALCHYCSFSILYTLQGHLSHLHLHTYTHAYRIAVTHIQTRYNNNSKDLHT